MYWTKNLTIKRHLKTKPNFQILKTSKSIKKIKLEKLLKFKIEEEISNENFWSL